MARTAKVLIRSARGRGKESDLLCPLCKDPASVDSQQHLLQCALLADNQVVQLDDAPVYNDLFSTNVKKQIAVATLLAERFKRRKELLNQK